MKLIVPEPTLKDKRRGWLAERGLNYTDLGRALGMTGTGASNLMRSDTARPERVEQLKALGMPENLLPKAAYIAPGPKPKK